MTKISRCLQNACEKRLFQTLQDGTDWVKCYLKWVNLTRPNKFMKFCSIRQRLRVQKHLFTIKLGRSKISKENIKRQSHSIKNHLRSYKKHVLRIIVFWLSPTTTSVWCTTTWVNIRKHFRITKK